jgi:hypothetical protein
MADLARYTHAALRQLHHHQRARHRRGRGKNTVTGILAGLTVLTITLGWAAGEIVRGTIAARNDAKFSPGAPDLLADLPSPPVSPAALPEPVFAQPSPIPLIAVSLWAFLLLILIGTFTGTMGLLIRHLWQKRQRSI